MNDMVANMLTKMDGNNGWKLSQDEDCGIRLKVMEEKG